MITFLCKIKYNNIFAYKKKFVFLDILFQKHFIFRWHLWKVMEKSISISWGIIEMIMEPFLSFSPFLGKKRLCGNMIAILNL